MLGKIKTSILFAVICCTAYIASGQNSATLYPDIDAKISSAYPSTNYQDDESFIASSSSGGGVTRSLIKFTLDEIPTNAIIGKATLKLYGISHSGTNSSYLYRITSTWTEASVTWNTKPTTTATGAVSLSTSSSSDQNYELDVTDFVKNWRGTDSSYVNYGLMLQLQTESGDKAMYFGSSDNGTSSLHPVLEILYTVPTDLSLYPDKDACVYSLAPTTSYGGIVIMNAETWTSGGQTYYRRSLVEMNLDTIPANSIITKSNIYLYWNSYTWSYHSLSNSAGYIERLTSSWDESNITWNNQPSSTTTGRISVPAATSQTQNYVIDMKSMVQDWVDNTYDNYGFILKLQTEAIYRRLGFASSDHANSSLYPTIDIQYVPGMTSTYTVAKNCNSSVGVIQLATSGGVPPYSYNWDTGSDSSSTSFASAGDYIVTITDARSNSIVDTISLDADTYSDVYWTYTNLITQNSDTIECSSSSSTWKSKAVSLNLLGSGDDGFIEYTVTDGSMTDNSDKGRYIGFSDSLSSYGKDSLRYAFYFDEDTVRIFESGSTISTIGTYQTDDRFQIYRENDSILYKVNETVVRYIETDSSKVLGAEVAFSQTGAYFEGLKLSFCPPSLTYRTYLVKNCQDTTGSLYLELFGGAPPYSYEWNTSDTSYYAQCDTTGNYIFTAYSQSGDTLTDTITVSSLSTVYTKPIWFNMKGLDNSQDTLTKTYETGWGNCGAVSRNRLESGEDGYVEYRVSQDGFDNNRTFKRIIGLSDTDVNANYNTIDYGWYFYRDSAKVCENGTFQTSYIKYTVGDIFRVGRINDSILYIINDDTLRTVFTDSTYNLMADVSLYSQGATFENIFSSFCTIDMTVSNQLSSYTIDSLRTLTLDISNGIPPYSYQWSTGDTTSSIKAYTGIYFVTVTDDWSSSVTARVDVPENVIWTYLDSCTVSSDTLLTEITQGGWSAGAASLNLLPADSNGFVEYEITDSSASGHGKLLGLSDENDGYGKDSIKYAFYFDRGNLYAYESGIQVGSYGIYTIGDVLRIERENDSIFYTKNDTTLRSVYVNSSQQLLVDVSFDKTDDYLYNVKVSFPAQLTSDFSMDYDEENNMAITASPYGGIPPYTYNWSTNDTIEYLEGLESGRYDVTITDDIDSSCVRVIMLDAHNAVTWTDTVGCAINSDTLIKTLASYLWNAGAASVNVLKSDADGFVEYKVTKSSFSDNRNFNRAFGLSDNNYDEKLDSINYAICFNSDSINIFESGTDAGYYGKYQAGDVFQVARNSDTIFYLKNGEVLRQVSTSSSQELLIDISMVDKNAYFDNIKASFIAPMNITYEVLHDCNDTSGTITVGVERGTPPYDYLWSTGASDTTATINYSSAGNYTVTVTDTLGTSIVKTINILYSTSISPSWINIDSLQVTGDSIECNTALSGWNGGAVSSNILESFENGMLEYYISDDAYTDNHLKSRYIGLSDEDENTSYNTINYAFFIDNDTLKITENGTVKLSGLSYNVGDRLQIIRSNDSIIYRQNTDTLQITTTDAALELMADISLKDASSYFDNVKLSFCTPELNAFAFDVKKECDSSSGTITVTASGGTAPYSYEWSPGGAGDTLSYISFSTSQTYYVTITDANDSITTASIDVSTDNTLSPVQWTGLTNCEFNGDSINKPQAATDSTWNSGTYSANVLASQQDGYLFYQVTKQSYYDNNTKIRMLGFTAKNTGTEHSDVAYGYEFNNNTVRLYDNNNYRFYDILYAPGDTFIISRTDANIYYIQNSDTLRTIEADPSLELMADASFYSREAYFKNVKVSFCPVDVEVYALDVRKDCDDNSGTIKAWVKGGTEPYSYQWSPGGASDTLDTKSFTSSATYYITVTDAADSVYIDSVSVSLSEDISLVSWTDEDSVSVTSDTIMSLTENKWIYGKAFSVNMLAPQTDGSVNYLVTRDDYFDNSSNRRYLGLTNRFDTIGFNMDYGFFFSGREIIITENGESQADSIYYMPGDMLEISRVSDTILYLLNGDTLRYVVTNPVKELRAVAMVADSGTYFKGIKASFCPEELTVFHMDVTKECNNSTGTVNANVYGGTPPYGYSWSTSDVTQQTTFSSQGTYYVTVTDDAENSVIDSVIVTMDEISNISWTDTINTEADSAGVLAKNLTADGWDAGATSLNTLATGSDGFISYFVTKEGYYDNCKNLRSFGLSQENTGHDSLSADFSYYFNKNLLNIVENDTVRIDSIVYQPGDTIEISRNHDTINFIINDSVYYYVKKSGIDNVSLIADVAFYNQDAYFENIKASFCPEDLSILYIDAYKDCDSDTGTISAVVAGGVPPYEYSWSTSDTTQSIQYTSTGSYYVTVTDSWDNTYLDTIVISNSVIDNIEWRILSGLTADEDSVVKTSSTQSWNNYALSSNIIYRGNDGEMEYLVTQTEFYDNKNLKRKIGLSEVPADTSLIDYAFYFHNDTVAITESDTVRVDDISWQPGDRFIIKRDGESIRYFKNDQVQRNVSTDSSLVLAIQTSLYDEAAYFTKIRANFCEATPILVPYELSKVSNDSLGDVTLNVTGGSNPYSYLWSTGSTASYIEDKPSGVYFVTVTDSLDYSIIQPVFITDDITWSSINGATVNTDTLVKTDTVPAWSSGAISSNKLGAYQDGAVLYQVTDTMNNNKVRVIGLVSNSQATGYNMNYAFYFDTTTVKIYEKGILEGSYGSYSTDDIFYIFRTDDTIQYVKNDTVLREVLTNPSKELMVKAALYDTSSYFENVQASFKSVSPIVVTYYISDNNNDSLFTIQLDVEGGTTPYTYEWSTGSIADTAQLTRGGYRVTITDYAGYKTVQPVVITDINWMGLAYTQDQDEKLMKKGNSPNNLWNAGAISVNRQEANTNGFLYYRISSQSFSDNEDKKRYIGLSSQNINSSDTTIMYAFFLDNDSLRIYESGEKIGTYGTYTVGDELQILRKEDTIIYMKNEVVLSMTYDSALASEELMVDVSIYNRYAYIDSLRTSFLSSGELDVDYVLTQNGQYSSVELTTTGGIPPYTYEWNTGELTDSVGGLLPGKYRVSVSDYAGNNVTQSIYVLEDIIWKTMDSTIVSGDTIASSASGTGWNSGGFSSNRLNSNRDGMLRCVITTGSLSDNAGKNRIIGLSEIDQNTSYTSVEYGYYFNENSLVSIYESGHLIMEDITCNSGDEFLLIREDSLMKYIKNDTLLYSSVTNKSHALYVDAAFEDNGAYFDSIEVSFIEPAVIQYLVSSQQDDTLFTMALDVSGGFPPYSYSWSSGGTADSISLPSGIYYVSVTDSMKNMFVKHISLVDAVWTNLANATASSDSLETTLSSGDWTSGASTKNLLVSGENGFVYYHVSSQSFSDNSSKERFLGLSTSDDGPGYTGIGYAFYFDHDVLRIYESGSLQGSYGQYAAGDILQIARQGDSIRYYHNGTSLRSVEVSSDEELMVDVAFHDPGSYFYGVKTSFTPIIDISYSAINETNSSTGSIEVEASGGTEPYAYLWNTGETTDSIGGLTAGNYIVTVTDNLGYTGIDTIYIIRDVAWINHTGLAVQSDTIVKTANTGWSNYIGVSANTIASGDNGYFRYIVHPESYNYNKNYYRMLGLSNKAESHTFASIDHCIYFSQSNFEVRENGVGIPLNVTYAVGDTFEVKREGSKVYYLVNDSIFRQVNVDSTKELVTVAAIYSKYAYFENVMASFRPETIIIDYDVTDKAGSTPGSITQQSISGGVVPYEYLWSTYETTASISNLEPGAYHLTVTDSLGTVQTATFFVKNKIEWDNMTNVSVQNDTITATGGGGTWNSGALSRCQLSAGEDGIIEYIITENADTTSKRVLGFCETFRGTNPVNLDYRIYLDAKDVKLFEGGNRLNYTGSYSVNDTIRLARYGNEMRYYINSNLLASTPAETEQELIAAVLFYDNGAYFHNVQASFTDPAYSSGEVKPVYSAQTLTIYPDKDAKIQSDEAANINYKNYEYFTCLKQQYYKRRSIIEANFEMLPKNAIVTSARLYLYGTNHSGTNSSYIERVTQQWYEDSVTWNNQPTTSANDTISLEQSQSGTENYEVDITDFVNNWVDSSWTNYGIMLKLKDENTDGELEFASSDNSYDSLRPKIVVSYYVPLKVKLTTYPSKDAYISSNNNNINYGDTSVIKSLQINSNADTVRSIIRFDLSVIPPTAVIDSAHLFLSGVDHDGNNPAYFRRVLSTWKEDSVTWDNKPETTSANQISLDASTSSTENYDIDVTDFVLNWTNRTYENYGLMLIHQYEGQNTSGSLVFASSDYEDTTMHPKLEIYYTIQPLDVPFDTVLESSGETPASVSLKSCGGVPPYTYQWSNGATTKNVSNLAYGNYVVTVTDAWGSFAVRNINVNRGGDATGTYGTLEYNWVQEKTYNYTISGSTVTQHTVGEGRVYSDKLSRTVQSVSKIESETDKVVASQVIYDKYGRPLLQTLPAATEQSTLDFIEGFITNPDNAEYNYSDFYLNDDQVDSYGDIINIMNTQTVNANSVLGQYYSNDNILEPYVATTQYPFSCVEYSTTQPGAVRKSTIPGDDFRLGAGRENQSYTIGVSSDELFNVYGYNGWTVNRISDYLDENSHESDTISFNEDQYCYKTISISPEGKEQITYSSLDGSPLASCISNAGGTVYEVKSAIEPWTDFIDIHLPQGCESSLKVDLKYKGSLSITDLTTDRIISDNIYIDFDPYNFGNDIYDLIQSGTYVSDCDCYEKTYYTNNGYNIEMQIVDDIDFGAYMKHAWIEINNLPAGFYRIKYNRDADYLYGRAEVKYNLNYSNYSLNYYDKMGRLKETVLPEGVVSFNPQSELVAVNNLGNGVTISSPLNDLYSSVPANNTDKAQYNEIIVSTRLLVDNIIVDNYDGEIDLTESSSIGEAVPIGYTSNHTVYRQVKRIAAVNSNGSLGQQSNVIGNKIWISDGNSCEAVKIDSSSNLIINLESGDTLGLLYQTRSSIMTGDNIEETESRNILRKTGSITTVNQSSENNFSLTQTNNIYNDFNIASYKTIASSESIPNLRSNSSGDNSTPWWDWPIDLDDYIDPTPAPVISNYKIVFDIIGIFNNGTSNSTHTLYADQELLYQIKSQLPYECADPCPATITFKTNIEKFVIDPSSGEDMTTVHINVKQVLIVNEEGLYDPIDLSQSASIIAQLNTYRVDKTPAHTMKETYEYNGKGLLESNVSPDAGLTEYVYRSDGNLRFSQDARQRAANKFTYIKYDKIGRITESGEYNDATGPLNFSTTMDGDIPDSDINSAYCSEQTYASYDVADVTYFESQSGLSIATYKQRFLTGQVSKSWNDNVITWYSYDEAGRPEWVVRHYNGMGSTTADGSKTIHYEYRFDGSVENVIYQKNVSAEYFEHKYDYDNDSRLSTVNTKLNGGSYAEQAEYKYYLHGALKRTELANDLQGIDYIYTVNGQLKSINNPDLDATANGKAVDPGQDGFGSSSFSKDLFGEAIDYYKGDYNRLETYVNSGKSLGDDLYDGNKSTDYYDGKIKAVRWQLAGQVTETELPAGSHWANYYNYDEFNRITEAVFGTYETNITDNALTATRSMSAISTNTVSGRLRAAVTSEMTSREIYQQALNIVKSNVSGSGSNADWYNGGSGIGLEDCTECLPLDDDTDNNNDDVVIGLSSDQFNVNQAIAQALITLGAEGTTGTTGTAESVELGTGGYFTASAAQEYREWNITYDRNGNIKTFNRNAYNQGTEQSPDVDMDELTYSHYNGTNRLQNVADEVSGSGFATDITNQAGNNYSYNNSGWQTGNSNENKYFAYNRFGMATAFYADASHTTLKADYMHDEGGFRVKKTDYHNAGTSDDETTWYIRDISGNILSTYTKTGSGSLTQEEMPVYGLSRIGTYQVTNTRYVYELNDHLGNLRALITEDGGDAGTEPDIISYKDYYAFGMEMPGRSLTPDAYKFGYQGLYAELDQETGLNSFWLRSYDARIGQFNTTDPYNYGFSSYNGMDNDPVSYVDPTGGYPKWWHTILRVIFGKVTAHADAGGGNAGPGVGGYFSGSYSTSTSGGSLTFGSNSSNSNESTGGNSGHYSGGGSGTGSSSPKTDHDGYPCTSKTGWGWDVTPAPHVFAAGSVIMTMSVNSYVKEDERDFNDIKEIFDVSKESKRFQKQFYKDLNTIYNFGKGKDMLNKIYNKTPMGQTHRIREASYTFHWGERTALLQLGRVFGSNFDHGTVSYGQENYMTYDGTFSFSHVTLGHELKHLELSLYGAEADINNEKKATIFENDLRNFYKLPKRPRNSSQFGVLFF